MTIRRLFVANRGEIALRIIRAAQALGIETVLGVSTADRETMAAEAADHVVVLGPPAAAQSYLDMKTVVHAAKGAGCDALHSGYGFLSERAAFARLCEENELVFVGPTADSIERLGDKISARTLAKAAGVPVSPGTDQIASVKDAQRAAGDLGYPVLMKASAGGGGRGMFIARGPSDIAENFDRASAAARAAFGDGTLYMERYVERARHVEVQVVGDGQGTVLHFGERDCSAQRRYQKVIEEAPATILPATLRASLHEAAIKLTREINYRNAGTVEFLYDLDREAFYFIEVNARIQVEHPVSETITGVDLVQLQLKVAGGAGLGMTQHDIVTDGHAIELRLNAEDPAKDFQPSPGRITRWQPPAGPWLRLDSHCRSGYLVPPFYDSMIGKLIVRGRDRPDAIERARDALQGFRLEGVANNLAFQAALLSHPDFIANQIDSRWLERVFLPAFNAPKE
ncbi:MAG: ATP-grasp domain-containing protein [Alphaproteobacteria bacterium]|nr:ATP-grasp domain-containing protein [Alphaproteobacteria bacterium]